MENQSEVIKKVFNLVFDKVYILLSLIDMTDQEEIKRKVFDKIFNKMFDKMFDNVYKELEKTNEVLFFSASKLLDDKDERSRKINFQLGNGKSICFNGLNGMKIN